MQRLEAEWKIGAKGICEAPGCACVVQISSQVAGFVLSDGQIGLVLRTAGLV
jgi:hypothetical protein